MKILVLGGTVFLGRHIVEHALARGHEVTLFNRGRHNPDLFPDVEKLRGDRDGDLGGLTGRRWDAAIDTSGYIPRVVRATATALADAVNHYTFISSISVYADFRTPHMDERAPVGTLTDPTVEEVTGESYGPLKALCEQAAERALPGRTTVIRPGLIVGPDDNTDRFTWWPARAARGGEFIAPGAPRDPFQVIDARDLAAFTLNAVERNLTGTYNLVSDVNDFKFGELVQHSIASAKKRAKPAVAPRATWLPADFLEAQKVEPWSEMPVWLPASGDEAAFAGTSNAAARAQGLRIMPLARTVDDTLAWHLSRPAEERDKLKAGIAPEKEAAVLAAWKARPA